MQIKININIFPLFSCKTIQQNRDAKLVCYNILYFSLVFYYLSSSLSNYSSTQFT